jgi:hypothetical protein
VHPCEPEARRLLCNISTNNQRGNGQSLPLLACWQGTKET